MLALPEDELTLTRMTYFSEQDVALINAHRKSENKMGFAVLLFCLRSIGFIPDINSPHPVSLLKSIASRLNLSDEFWQDYALGRDTTWREHLTELYRYINLRTFTKQIQQDCIGHLIPLATRTDKGILLAEELLDYFQQNCIIISGMEVLDRTCAEAMASGDKQVFTALNTQLTPKHKTALDSLLSSPNNQLTG
ncbi:protein of unknown function [Xenorhabdus bovienii]|uniref:DUF4158 domain-containing protein n=1 Tax=Xenorhabdus bovienii TaxID=40576 RepID=A0A0B6X6P9_XENBV|nr:protein of unknown function [Xenorhabdus bovienii]